MVISAQHHKSISFKLRIKYLSNIFEIIWYVEAEYYIQEAACAQLSVLYWVSANVRWELLSARKNSPAVKNQQFNAFDCKYSERPSMFTLKRNLTFNPNMWSYLIKVPW
jgi:hypothetical protein